MFLCGRNYSKGDVDLSNTSLPIFDTPEALYATFEIKRRQEIFLDLSMGISRVASKSGFETTTNPPYVIFKRITF